MFDLTGRRALVTGSGQGVGLGIAQRLAQQGAAVAINDLVADRAEQAANQIVNNGGRATTAVFDVTDYEAVVAGIGAAESALAGPIDILVNNAGVPSGMGLKPFRETTPEDWARQIDLNTYGVIHCCRALINPMAERGFGRIVTVSSSAGTIGLGLGVSPYAAGKGGAISFMRHLAIESSRNGITANTVALGMMDNGADADVRARIERSIPVGRIGQPDDVAALVLYLASDEASWMTGQTLQLNGGSVTT